MRTAIISDIHGNLAALEAVVSHLKHDNIDQVVCLGDLASLGPQPNETLELFHSLDATTVRGNHEDAILNIESLPGYGISNDLVPTLQWCRDQLSSTAIKYLNDLPMTREIEIGAGKRLFCFHGSPTSTTGTVVAESSDVELCEIVKAGRGAVAAAGGHTHLQFCRWFEDKLILNPGSVGCAFRTPSLDGKSPTLKPFAEFGVLECTEEAINLELHQVSIDVEQILETLHSSALPLSVWWTEQYQRYC